LKAFKRIRKCAELKQRYNKLRRKRRLVSNSEIFKQNITIIMRNLAAEHTENKYWFMKQLSGKPTGGDLPTI
jgi:hypothetical protein